MHESQALAAAPIGILMLDTRFPRIPGDVGNPATFGFPVRIRIVAGAGTERVVTREAADRALLADFVAAAQALEREGVRAIVTTCGFLSLFQDELAEAVDVPVVASSLLLIPLVRRMLRRDRVVGVVTADSRALSERHLAAAGVTAAGSVAVTGIESGEELPRLLLRAKAAQKPTLDVARAEADVLAACRGLLQREPRIGAWVFECTNLQPYAPAVQAATSLPVFGIYHAITLLHDAAVPPRF